MPNPQNRGRFVPWRWRRFPSYIGWPNLDQPWPDSLRIGLVRTPRGYLLPVHNKLLPPILAAPVVTFIAPALKVQLQAVRRAFTGAALTSYLNPPTVLATPVGFMPPPIMVKLQAVNRSNVF